MSRPSVYQPWSRECDVKMLSSAELEKLVSDRGSTYEFLARIYRAEVDQELLEQMARIRLPAEVDLPEICEGYRMLSKYLEHRTANMLTDLAVDYAKIFLGAGVAGSRTYPYESVYMSHDGLVMQDARDQVLILYRQEGLGRTGGDLNEPEDHIALELEFMVYLCQKTTQALRDGSNGGALAYMRKQRDFLQEHLVRWVPAFCSDVQRLAREDLYKAVAKITIGYLSMEQHLIGELMGEIKDTQNHAI